MRPIPKQTTLTQNPFCSLPRSRSSRLASSRFTSSLASATPPVISRSTIPHILVYALGNYPFPLSRHSLPQSLLPLILERYRSSSTGIKKATGNKEQGGGCLKLLKKHECWIGGGLVDLHRDPYEMQQARNSPQSFEVSPGSALLTIVKPRVLMNIAGRPLPFLLRSAKELPHAQSITDQHPGVDIDSNPTLLVLHDSLEMPPMTLTKPRRNVGPQGHNGLRSIEASLATRDFWRIGLGIGRPSGGKSRGDGVRDWVLADIESDSDERIFWEGEGTAAIHRAIKQIAQAAKSTNPSK